LLSFVRLPAAGCGRRAWERPPSLPADALARGERVEIIPHGGVRFGGNFRDRLSGEPMNIGASAAAGLTVDIAWDANTELELLYSRQATRLKRDGAAPGSPSFDLDIEYYQIGGTYLFDKSGALQPYFAATIGATRFAPDRGLASDTRFSFSAGGGAKLPLTRHLGLRFDGRAFVTMIDSDSTVFCNIPGNCAISFRGDTLVQWDASLGLILAF
jgi:hypothetical protein